jgi:hypothetical protein
METYDPAKVGTRIAWGRSHSVYHYGDHEVIRFPRAESWMWKQNLLEHFEHEIALFKEYFGEYVLDTRVAQEPGTHRIVTIQPYITGHYLSKSDLQDVAIRRQFDDFMSRYDALVRDGHGQIDLVGQGGITRRCLSNIIIQQDKKLRLFDAKSWELDGQRRLLAVRSLIKTIALWKQNSTLQYLRN